MLVASNVFYPGWNAYVDGRQQPVLEVYGAIQGVVVEAGRHEVVLAFEPRSAYAGLALSALGLPAVSAALLSHR